MHEQMMKLVAQDAVLYRVNCDSICFSLRSNQEPNIKISNYIPGSFKYEYDDIQSFAQLSVNTCSILHKTKEGTDIVTMKTGGIQQNDIITANLRHQVFVDAVEASVRNHVAGDGLELEEDKNLCHLKVENIRSVTKGLTSKKERRNYVIQMKSALTRRQLDPASYETFPLGYVGDNAMQKFVNPFKND